MLASGSDGDVAGRQRTERNCIAKFLQNRRPELICVVLFGAMLHVTCDLTRVTSPPPPHLIAGVDGRVAAREGVEGACADPTRAQLLVGIFVEPANVRACMSGMFPQREQWRSCQRLPFGKIPTSLSRWITLT